MTGGGLRAPIPRKRNVAGDGDSFRESLSRALSTLHVVAHLRQKVLRHLAIHAARGSRSRASVSFLTERAIAVSHQAGVRHRLALSPMSFTCKG
jgi:hypothetical protein